MEVFLNNYKKIVVNQEDKDSGCIPAGYEWIIRFAKIYDDNIINDIKLAGFQEEFNLFKNGLGANSFVPIREAIQKKYPRIKIEIEEFKESNHGAEKIEFIKKLIRAQNPCLISVPVFKDSNFTGYHIMPITGFNDNESTLFLCDPGDKINYYKKTKFETILNMHTDFEGGHDVSWLPLN